MKRRFLEMGMAGAVFLGALCLVLGGSIAQAEYARSSSERSGYSDQEGSDRIIDLKRFRKGNYEWDTQEMISAGFNALHQENVKILNELGELKSQVAKLKEKR